MKHRSRREVGRAVGRSLPLHNPSPAPHTSPPTHPSPCVTLQMVALTASSHWGGDVWNIVDKDFTDKSMFFTHNQGYSHVVIDLGPSRIAVCPVGYRMAHRAGINRFFVRTWSFEVSCLRGLRAPGLGSGARRGGQGRRSSRAGQVTHTVHAIQGNRCLLHATVRRERPTSFAFKNGTCYTPLHATSRKSLLTSSWPTPQARGISLGFASTGGGVMVQRQTRRNADGRGSAPHRRDIWVRQQAGTARDVSYGAVEIAFLLQLLG